MESAIFEKNSPPLHYGQGFSSKSGEIFSVQLQCKLFEEHVSADFPLHRHKSKSVTETRICRSVKHGMIARGLGMRRERYEVPPASCITWWQHAACVLFRWFTQNLKMGFSR